MSGLLKRIGLAEVYNPSMLPLLRPGDRLVVKYGSRVRPGAVVVLRHPLQHDLLIVKRAVERRSGGWWVVGDNPQVRNDSREFGAVPDDLMVARVWVRLRPPRGPRRRLRPVLPWVLSAVRPLPALRGGRSGPAYVPSLLSWLARRLRAR
ncbi:signal peptidase [Streptomyces abyssalis]|uniref:Signal peptidase n=1 Tax=Streptomyces abyssalis TaxID=933944 RepID=A0A1E7JGH4_9ACTN|nr:nickel-type superoxide dismutase maturation protease [Streptomyces abyssalis]OEU85569.1 signal peptidase [Streptomyces abyssalis]OEU92967.1 signal peptidase [Streptomyces abyssalis]OEU96023.1 signal peptidase [Streptomyces abyssalis]OEV30073.1 signal peptidase [Streptomyces nanshensis]